jgi:hypothetical protein
LAWNLAFDAKGDLFVSAGNSEPVLNAAQIVEFTSGGVQSTFATIFGYAEPKGLVIDKKGNVYTSDGTGAIYVFPPTGGLGTSFSGVGPNSTPGIVLDPAGNMFAASNQMGVGAIYEIAPNESKSTFATNVPNPMYLAFSTLPEPSAWLLASIGAIGFSMMWRVRFDHRERNRMCAS